MGARPGSSLATSGGWGGWALRPAWSVTRKLGLGAYPDWGVDPAQPLSAEHSGASSSSSQWAKVLDAPASQGAHSHKASRARPLPPVLSPPPDGHSQGQAWRTETSRCAGARSSEARCADAHPAGGVRGKVAQDFMVQEARPPYSCAPAGRHPLSDCRALGPTT